MDRYLTVYLKSRLLSHCLRFRPFAIPSHPCGNRGHHLRGTARRMRSMCFLLILMQYRRCQPCVPCHFSTDHEPYVLHITSGPQATIQEPPLWSLENPSFPHLERMQDMLHLYHKGQAESTLKRKLVKSMHLETGWGWMTVTILFDFYLFILGSTPFSEDLPHFWMPTFIVVHLIWVFKMMASGA